jgi:hypothetical protein
MRAAWSPIPIAPHAHSFQIFLSSFRRCPQLPSREPLHFRVRMLVANTIEGREQVLAFGCTKGRWQTPGQDRPVRISGGIVYLVGAGGRLSPGRVSSAFRQESSA